MRVFHWSVLFDGFFEYMLILIFSWFTVSGSQMDPPDFHRPPDGVKCEANQANCEVGLWKEL